MKVLVTGAGGMLGADVVRSGHRAGHDLRGLTHDELDVSDGEAVEDAVLWPPELERPEAVINSAAFTDVDGAESHRDAAYAVNALGARNLALAAANAGIPMVHVSTDYVFAGSPQLDGDGRTRPYLESDEPAPRSAYGESKLAGEREVLEASALHVVARSSWLFGVGGPNFAATMLRLGAERPFVDVVDDQVGCPTWTGHLAPALIGLIERGITGLVHMAGGGEVSWNGFAREIFRHAELTCEVRATTNAALARAAPRPAYSALASERDDVLPLPPWQDGLAGYLAARAGMMRA
jgi:dTDP-4-dehydrorhamnose reductase